MKNKNDNETNNFDVIVVGAGHAGIEASLAAARMGLSAAVITINLDNIGQMSCNPAIGGLAKGHLVREVDALGGEMGKAIDKTGIQFRTLNTKKGPAVRSSRAQADMFKYKTYMKTALESAENLTIIQSMVDSLIVKNGKAAGVVLWTGENLYSSAVILTTGTFLRGLVHIGLFNYNAGRAGDFASNNLSLSLLENGKYYSLLKRPDFSIDNNIMRIFICICYITAYFIGYIFIGNRKRYKIVFPFLFFKLGKIDGSTV